MKKKGYMGLTAMQPEMMQEDPMAMGMYGGVEKEKKKGSKGGAMKKKGYARGGKIKKMSKGGFLSTCKTTKRNGPKKMMPRRLRSRTSRAFRRPQRTPGSGSSSRSSRPRARPLVNKGRNGSRSSPFMGKPRSTTRRSPTPSPTRSSPTPRPSSRPTPTPRSRPTSQPAGVLQHNSLDTGQDHNNQEDLQCKVDVHRQVWLGFVVLVMSKLKDVVLFKVEEVQVDQQDLEQLKEQSL